jgi:hypothetical protein
MLNQTATITVTLLKGEGSAPGVWHDATPALAKSRAYALSDLHATDIPADCKQQADGSWVVDASEWYA